MLLPIYDMKERTGGVKIRMGAPQARERRGGKTPR